MKEGIKDKWVAALRSGDYKQCTGQLRDGDKFCCLGVLCDLMDPKGWDNFYYRHRQALGHPATTLPSQAKGWAGMWSGSGAYSLQRNLANDNDNGKTFNEIANIIEDTWERL